MKLKKSTVTLLAVSLALILLGSIFASLFNTGFGSVSVKRISFDTTNGSLSGLLYMPKGASESNPRPAVIVTHGYLNSAEMQDANAIELSRRGYVVLALDMYDHGHSKLNKDVYGGTEFFDLWSKFWIHSMNDAATYMYSQPYVLKDADGNGVMGVTGHSMGGFSSTLALAFDEQAAQATGIRKLSCGLTEGSDFSYSAFVGIDAATADALGGGRIMGKVAARYDEFFFNNPEETGGTVRQKDYVSTPDGQTFLQTENAAANTWYNTSDGGKRIIYEPAQTHPWNHFSKETTGYAIDFYKTAFAGYTDGIKDIASSSQIWQFKELFSFIALIGFVMFFIPFVEILLGLPFFNKAKTELPAPVAVSKLTGAKLGRFALMLSLVVVPAVFFAPLYDDAPASPLMDLLFVAGIVFAVCGLVGICLGLRAEAGKGKYICGSVLTVLAGAALSFIAKKPLYQSLATWVAPSVNSIAVWTLGCAVISVLAMSLIFTVSKAKDGAGLRDYGISLNPLTIIASLLTACVALVVGYLILFAIDAVLHVDFRLWVFAYKTFDMNILPAVCKYLPTFFLFYFVSSASIFANTNTDSMQGVKGYLAAIALNAGGSMLWLCRQYVTLFSTGVAAHPDAALSGIVLVAVCAVLVVAAIISRALYKKCGNIWVAAFLNAFLVTIMTIANTTVYMK
jgi:pimeloyl-ACP methyl ester carboxylesterase